MDSVYGAYLKAYYPYEFYTIMLQLYTENKDIDKVSALKKEMEYFNIHIGELRFGLDNTGFVIDRENNRINQSIKTVKYINSKVSKELLDIYNPNLSFLETLELIKSETSTNSRQLEVLIKINYFKEFGTIKKLLTFTQWYDIINKRKTFKRLDIDPQLENYIKSYSDQTDKLYKNLNKSVILENIWNDLSDDEIDFIEKIRYELEYLGYISSTIPNEISVAKVNMVSSKFKSVNLTSVRNGESKWFKCKKLPKKDDYIVIYKISKKKGWNDRQDLYIEEYEKL